MIVVVEGPSGAGKTTWVRRYGGLHALLEWLPDHSVIPEDPTAAARFWVDRNARRWDEVLERERRDGLVVVDTDPFSSTTPGRSGAAARRRASLGSSCAESHVTPSRLRYGLADLIYVSDIDAETLRVRRDGDATRRRGGFETHVKLRDSLLEWYRRIDALEPGRVVFGRPATGIADVLIARGSRRVRSGGALFDRLISALPD